jgi:putative heme-binding domain-containing protein
MALNKTESVEVRPALGTFGIHNAEILAPGDPYRSVLYYRMAKLGPGHMPYIGTKIVDTQGLALVHDWIRQLPIRWKDEGLVEQLIALDEPTVLAEEARQELVTRWRIALRAAKSEDREKPNEADLQAAAEQMKQQAADRVKQRAANRTRLIGELLSSPARAMLLARAARRDQLPATIRPLVLDTAIAHESLGIRDLFEPLVPDELRSERLGDSIQPEEILKLQGDIARGRKLFHETQSVQCRNCHRIGKDGKEVGPDLSLVGKKNDRAKILENILDPSKNIDPKYITWLIETDSGKVLTGLLVKKDTDGVVLRDAQNKEHHLKTDQIEEMFPQRKSLMPDLLLREFTAEQVADLVAYLASLK